MSKGNSVKTFPIHEYWLDIGQKEDFAQAQQDYKTYFSEQEGHQ